MLKPSWLARYPIENPVLLQLIGNVCNDKSCIEYFNEVKESLSGITISGFLYFLSVHYVLILKVNLSPKEYYSRYKCELFHLPIKKNYGATFAKKKDTI